MFMTVENNWGASATDIDVVADTVCDSAKDRCVYTQATVPICRWFRSSQQDRVTDCYQNNIS